MKLYYVIPLIFLLAIFSIGCSGGSGIDPERQGTVVGVVGDFNEFPELADIALHLNNQYGPASCIAPGERPMGMQYIFVTGFLNGPGIGPISDNYFDPGEFHSDVFWPEPLVMRDQGHRMPGVRMIIVIGRNREELRRILRYVRDELNRGKRFDFEAGEWHFQERPMDPKDMPMHNRDAQWNWTAHQRMAEIAGNEMGYNTKTRKDAGQAYAIDFYYNGELKYTSYIAGDETPMELILRGSWEIDVIHDNLFDGIFENLLLRRLGHAWFPPDGWLGTADDFCYTYAWAAGVNFITDKEGKAYYFLGMSIHLIEDVGLPLHTEPDLVNQLLWHTAIEEDLDEFWYDEIDYALPGQPVHPFTDIKGAVAELATASNADFYPLIDAYVWGWLWGYDEYYSIARTSAVRTMSYVKGMYNLAEPLTW